MAEYRQWREQERTWLKDVVPLDTPYNIQVETSSLCNAKCIYCAHSHKDHGVWEGNMSMELFQKIVRDAGDFPQRIKLFDMFGFGEPLCNSDFADMIALARKSGVVEKISFTTNGLLFTPERADRILAAGVDTIRVSLQGIDPEQYERVCGVQVDFEAFLRNLCYLYEHRGNTKIRMKIADLALKGVPGGRKRFEEIFGAMADSLFVETILPMYAGIDYDSIDMNIRKNTLNGRENVEQKDVRIVCHRPFYRMRVAANGDVTAACCDKPHDVRYGNIWEKHLVELWNGGGHVSFLKVQLEGKRFQHKACRECVMANDITNERDILDPYAGEILERLLQKEGGRKAIHG